MQSNGGAAGASIITILALASVAAAQPTNAVLSWEFSTDGGTTWTPNSIAVPGGSPITVNVRGVMWWQSHTATFDGFGGISFDPFVARTTGAGSGDEILDPLMLGNGGLVSRPYLAVMAFPDLIKIDRDTDLLPPGSGTGWVSPGQIPNIEGFSNANPIRILSYAYLADGTPGTRTVSSVISQRTDGTNVAFFDLDFGFSPQYATVEQHPGTITVVPAPATLGVVAFGALAIARRRRR